LWSGKKRLFFLLTDVASREGERPESFAPAEASARSGSLLTPADFAAPFVTAFDRLDRAAGGHNFVSLVALRPAIPAPRAAFDAGLHELRRNGQFTLSAAEGRHGVTAEEQEAGIREDGTLLLYVSRRLS
jgi:hypothetical protein